MIGGDRRRPDHAGVIVVLFDRGRRDARGANAVATHHVGRRLAVRVENVGVHRHGVLRAELEDVADLNATGDEIGTLYGITGAFGDALIGTNAGAGVMCSHPVVIDIGTIDLECGETSSGNIKWTATYIPWDDGAEMYSA